MKHKPDAKDEQFYQDLLALIKKYHTDKSAMKILALTSNIVGKVIAMQDQRTVTVEMAMEIVIKNIEIGNREAFAELLNLSTDGRSQ